MTATTTLKLPDDLKARIARVAESTGKSSHAFMLEVLQAQADLAERRRAFLESARMAELEVAQYGLVYDADEVFAYMRDLLEGRDVAQPSPIKL